MKKLFIIVGIMLIVAMAGFALVSCSGGGIDDTYYEVKGYGSSATLNESSWIKLKSGKWSDDDGESGKYKLDGDKITILQDGEELMTGTLKDGTLELEIWGMPAGTYRTKAAQEKISSEKSGDSSTSNPENGSSSGGNNSGSSGGQSGSNDKEPEKQVVTKTLSLYNLDGSTTTKEIEVGKALGTLPSPTRSNYSFQGWENLDGDVYTASSLMPSTDLELYPLWEKSVSSYSDSFLSFSPARQGYKNELAFLHGSQYGAEKYLYVEITPDDLTGSIDTSNNFSLRNLKNLNYSVSAGYTAMWYQGNFNNPNGAQRFSLGYGSNIQLITVSDSGGTVQCTYLLDIYVLRNYTVSLYKTIFDNSSYGNVTVLEGDSLPITSRPVVNGDLEFDRWVYYDGSTYRYKRFTYATEVTSNIRIYQAYKPCTAAVDLEGGTLEGNVEVEPYMDYVTLPIPTKTDYDFLGWKKADGSYFTNNRGSSQWSYYTSSTGTLTAAWKKKVMYYSFADDVLTILPTEYNAVYLENGTISSMWYTVIVEDDTITVNSTNSADIGDEVTIAALTDGREGYTFLGWYDGVIKTQEGENSKYAFIVPGQRKTYTAEWTYYTVRTMREINGENETNNNNAYSILSFDLNGGESGKPDDQTITKSNGMMYPTTLPIRAGYVFAGWYTTPSCTYLFDFTQEINGNTRVYAHWIPYIGAGILPLNGTIASISAPSKSNTSSYKYYAFVPLVNESITVFSAGSNDSFGYLYDSNKTQLSSNDDSGNGNNFSITYSVTAGTLYYVAPCAYGSSSITLSLSMSGATYPLAGGTSSNAERKVTVGDSVTLTENQLSGYTWLGWYDGETKVSEGTSFVYSFEMPAENKIYCAKWSRITLAKNVDEAGVITDLDQESYVVGEEVIVTARTNPGYTWLGWYDGETKVSEDTSLSYIFIMPAENKSFTAKWLICPVTLVKNIEQAGFVNGMEGATVVGEMTTITANTNTGYTWLGWFSGETKVSEDTSLSYTFLMPMENMTYTAKWIACPVSLEKSISEAGTVSGVEKTAVGAETTISVVTNAGYTWLGWYDGETKVSDGTSLTYTFTMAIENKLYTAKWIPCPVILAKNIEEAGYVSGLGRTTAVGEMITITANTNIGFIWLGWYDGETKISPDLSNEFSFEMSVGNKTYTAKWEPCWEHQLDENCVCTKCGFENHMPAVMEKGVCRHGEYVFFGTYPQSKVTDEMLISTLNAAAGALPTSSNSQDWISYRYYRYGRIEDFMWYIDLEQNGEKYRGVYYMHARDLFTSGSSWEDRYASGYDTVYWFKYEPIKWRILSEANGEVLMLAEMILDCQEYYSSTSSTSFSHNGGTGYANNYELSNIRKWLNDSFYNTAFTDLQKQLILITLVDNSPQSTAPDSYNIVNNQYACANTQDNIFLLSEQEATNSAYGFSSDGSSSTASKKDRTDYAKSQTNWANGSYSSITGDGCWWLRSPTILTYVGPTVEMVASGGQIGIYQDYDVYYAHGGVVPALKITLE